MPHKFLLLTAIATAFVLALGWGQQAVEPELIVDVLRPGGSCVSPTGSNNTSAVDSWRLPAGGVTYRVNRDSVPRDLDKDQAVGAIQAAASSWNGAAAANPDMTYGGTTTVKAAKRDGMNAVSFGGAPGGSIAVAYIWALNGTVLEVDMSLANGFRWSANNSISEDPLNPSDDCSGQADRVDVQDVATHEFGHWEGVKHTSTDSAYNHRTLYPYASYREVFKRSLADGDVNSLRAIYGP